MKKYRIYIDETGNSDLKSSANPNHKYLSLTGVILDLEYVRDTFHNDMEQLKNNFFHSHPDEPVILHRKEMINKQKAFHVLNDKEIEEAFNDRLLSKIEEWDYTIISVLIDKQEHNDLYNTWKFDPYHYCLAVLLERYIMFLQGKNTVGDVIIESRGGNEDKRLKKSFNGLYENGTNYFEASKFQEKLTSKQLKVKPKTANISGLQLADILAHPCRMDILYKYKLIAKKKEVFGDKIIAIIQKKYHQKDGKIEGVGIKKLP